MDDALKESETAFLARFIFGEAEDSRPTPYVASFEVHDMLAFRSVPYQGVRTWILDQNITFWTFCLELSWPTGRK